jgi:hypothetical protein
MSHNNGKVTNLRKKSISKFKKFPPFDEGGVGGLNRTPHLMKPLIIVLLSFESYVTFVMNLKP